MDAPSLRKGSRCAPRMAGCPATCLHRQNVEAYRAQRELELAALEAETNLLPGDVEWYLQNYGPLIDFKTWLTTSGGGLAHYRDSE